ncbi:SH3 domain-binding protein 1 [Hyperolius riggenbachi]|uniref:SH3 domain-binding protein 1 n=1 Tax=Hyperolius riggenbachi TaxID=752182 RepID=UPI0035A33DF6
MIQRHINRMKQLANPGPGRSQDVTDLLPEDLLLADQQVEAVKRAAHLVGKRLSSCIQSTLSSDFEKRLKKLALMSLSSAMAESLKELESESSLRRTLEMGCCVESSLAQTLAEYEMNLERDVLQPLNKLSEDELPTILKHRKHLQKLLTDWNSAKTRLSQTQKNMSAGQGGGSTGAPAKLESLKEEEEELRRKVEQSKDDYLSDLYHFGTKENECKNYFIQLLELQADFHRKSLAQLTEALGELSDTLKESVTSPSPLSPAEVYGVPLAVHLNKFGCDIAVPISACVKMLLAHGMREEGLFRLAAGASVLKRLKANLGSGSSDLAEFKSELHAVAGALKSYLRELPEPLMTSELFDDWLKAASVKDPEKRQESYREVCAKLPPENYNNLRYIIKFLAKLAEHQEVNKMTPSNIAIVLGPNLLWARCDGDQSLLDMASASPILVVSVVEGLISCAAEVFQGDVDFGIPEENVTPSKEIYPQSQKPILKSDSVLSPTSPASSEIETEAQSESQEVATNKCTPVRTLHSADESNNVMGSQGDCSPSTARKGKRPAPLRPGVPPPVQPRAASTGDQLDEQHNPRPIPRRNVGGSLRVPNMPPPHPPLPKVALVKPEAADTDQSKKAPPTPLPRNRIQSSDN